MTIELPPADPTPSTPGVPPGWYHDPGSQRMRWWSGTSWTEHFAPTPILARPMKQNGVAFVLLIFLGGFAAHHFYLNRVGSAIGMLALWWGGWLLTTVYVGWVAIAAVVIWWVVDLGMIPTYVVKANAELES